MGCTQSQAAKGARQSKSENKTKELKTDKSTKVQATTGQNIDKDSVEQRENEKAELSEADILLEDKSHASENKIKKNIEITDVSTAPAAEEKSPDSKTKAKEDEKANNQCTTTVMKQNTVTQIESEKTGAATSTIPEDEGEVTGESKHENVDTGTAAKANVDGNNKNGMDKSKNSENNKDTEVVFKSVKKKGSYFRKMFSSPSKDCPKETEKEKLKESNRDPNNEGPSNDISRIAAATKDGSNNENDNCVPTSVDVKEENEEAVDLIPGDKEVSEKEVGQIPGAKDDALIEAEKSTQIEKSEHEDKEPMLVDGKGSVKDIISLFSQGDSCNTLQTEKKAKYKTAPALNELGRSPSVAERQKAIMNSYKEATSNSNIKNLQDRRIQSMKEETGQRRSSAEMKSYWHTVEEINEVVVTRKAF